MHKRICLAAIFLLAALPACTVTFRQKPIAPLNTSRNYKTGVKDAWTAAKAVIEEWPHEIQEANFEEENGAGLLTTDFKVLSDQGDKINHLKKVAYAQGASFIGGRYALTVTVREVRGGLSRIKVVARIEGYLGEDYGYQVLRSTGLLEEAVFNRINERLGTTPVDRT
ncbi:MAG: hypothetical protein ACE5HV_08385 [Acidobacteriota bacterium]